MTNTNKLFEESIISNFNEVAKKIVSSEKTDFTPLDSSDLIDDVFIEKDDADNALYQYGVISAVKAIRKFEREELGGIQTDFNNTVNVANSIHFVLATNLIDRFMLETLGKTYVESKEELETLRFAMTNSI